MSEIEQNTPAWYEQRAGHVTASRIDSVMAKPQKGKKDSAMRKAYLAQLVFERLSKKSLEEERGNFYDIKRGKDLEAVARVEYEMKNGVVVDTAGFIKHPTLPWAGCSPDGLIGTEGMVQLKAPRRHVHLDWILRGIVPSEHEDQMLFELACEPQRSYNDFVSYVDDLEELPQLQIFQVRLRRNANRIAELEAEVARFNAEVEAIVAKLSNNQSLEQQLRDSLEMVKAKKAVEEMVTQP